MHVSKDERIAAIMKHAPTRKVLDGLSRKELYKKIADLADHICIIKYALDKAERQERQVQDELVEVKREVVKLASAVDLEQRISARMMIRNLELSGKV